MPAGVHPELWLILHSAEAAHRHLRMAQAELVPFLQSLRFYRDHNTSTALREQRPVQPWNGVIREHQLRSEA